MTWQRLAFFGGLCLVSFVATLALAAAFLVRLPADYFTGIRRPHFEHSHLALRVVLIGLKNLLGIVIIAAGLAMSIPGVPGQGLLTIFIGLTFVDFPGKFRLERALILRPRVLGAIDRLRARFGKLPLERPPARPAAGISPSSPLPRPPASIP